MSTSAVFGYAHFNKNSNKYEEILVQVRHDGTNKKSYAHALAMLKTKIFGSKDLFKEIIDCAYELGGDFRQFGAINTDIENKSMFGEFIWEPHYRRGTLNSVFDENENMFIVKYNKETDDIESICIKEECFIDTKTPVQFQKRLYTISSLEESLNLFYGDEIILPLQATFQILADSAEIKKEFSKTFSTEPFKKRPYGAPRGALQVNYSVHYKNLSLCSLSKEQKAQNKNDMLGHNYFIYDQYSLSPLESFETKQALEGWLAARGLHMESIPNIGEKAYAPISGSFIEHENCFGKLPDGEGTQAIRSMFDGHGFARSVIKEIDGIAHHYMHNPNEKEYLVEYNQLETLRRINNGNYSAGNSADVVISTFNTQNSDQKPSPKQGL